MKKELCKPYYLKSIFPKKTDEISGKQTALLLFLK